MKYIQYIIYIVFIFILYKIYQLFFGETVETTVEKDDVEKIKKLKDKYSRLKNENINSLRSLPVVYDLKAEAIYSQLNSNLPSFKIAINNFGEFASSGICTMTRQELIYIYACFGIRELQHYADKNEYLDMFAMFKQVFPNYSQIAVLNKIYSITNLL